MLMSAVISAGRLYGQERKKTVTAARAPEQLVETEGLHIGVRMEGSSALDSAILTVRQERMTNIKYDVSLKLILSSLFSKKIFRVSFVYSQMLIC